MQKNSEVVFLFDGQGSQYYSLGKDLYDCCTTFRNTLLELDAEAYRLTGQSIVEHIYHHTATLTDSIRVSNPARYMVQYALAMTLQVEYDIHPTHVLGNNLGEAVAAAVGGAVDPLDMLAAVTGQAAALEDNCEKGGMITVLENGLTNDAHRRVYEIYEAATLVTIHNCGHFTLSADAKALEEIKPISTKTRSLTR
ncbi:acyltransferase domain-containing protein [Paraflavitalea speifideaquila]|uniref:acyltransferase domain-containing protein n=1 Tax=Paraflavitalea speifideaquila TaxID=3076558 RepID=UPI0028E74BC2|nr:acyltransferase domain-containing protein [Paraflavitalea speifideiaquila]